MRPQLVIWCLHKILFKRADQRRLGRGVQYITQLLQGTRRSDEQQLVEFATRGCSVYLIADKLCEPFFLQCMKIMPLADRMMRTSGALEGSARPCSPSAMTM